MRSCRKQYQSRTSQVSSAVRKAAAPQTSVHRYVHPIRTTPPPARSPTEETLFYVLEALTRQTEQLDRILHLLEGDNLDTM